MTNKEETHSHLGPLRLAAAKISESTNSSETILSLNRALELFSLEADRLTGAYESLKEEFTLIHQELEESNQKLMRKVAELDVLTSYLESILANISQGILFIDLNGDVTTYNSAAESIIGTPSEEVLFNSFWHSFNDDFFSFSMREALLKRTVIPLAFVTLTNEKDELKVLEVNTSFMSEQEKPGKGYHQEVTVRKMEGIIVMFRDITEIRHLQMLAARNDRLKELGEMAAIVAHEIRNPLGGIKGFASLLKRDVEDKPELVKMANCIIQGTDTLNRLVTDILNYARPINPEFEKCSISQLLQEVKEAFEADPTLSNRVTLTLIPPKDSLFAVLDSPLIKSALMNLLMNARQAMSEGGVITLKAEKQHHTLILTVADTGEGISTEHLTKIFSPFFTTKKEGSGFGLVEVHKVVEAHQGKIDVKSCVGKGTTFTLTLPMNL